jgi:hypothetical protein
MSAQDMAFAASLIAHEGIHQHSNTAPWQAEIRTASGAQLSGTVVRWAQGFIAIREPQHAVLINLALVETIRIDLPLKDA